MSKNSNYNSTNRSKHYLKCHLIFVCKYRKYREYGQPFFTFHPEKAKQKCVADHKTFLRSKKLKRILK
ncbi:hypothetical protein M0Q97_05195 [Candidatus Dojkabacteria bacterium]|jgi:REP element-mobilizing transposase RayT|nr:hypothetical protein [Candidatus Dojkabacteria bacterium]